MSTQDSDPRTRRSRAALEAALRELIAERDLIQISISDITKRAGVNRSTFYEHYTDVHDLAAAACTTVFDELVSSAPVSATGRTDNSLSKLFAHVADHASLYLSLLGKDGSARVINHLLQRITTATHVSRMGAQDGPHTHADDPADVPHDPAAAFIAGAVLGIVIDWLRRGCPGTPEQMGAALLPHIAAAAAADTGTPPLPR